MADTTYGAFQEAQQKGDQHKLSEFALLDAQLDQAGAQALGKTFQSLSMPGAQQIGGGPSPPPMGGPPQAPGQMGGPPPQPPMQPGQPSVPMQQLGGFAGRFGGDPGQGPGMMQGGGQRLSTAMQGAPQMQPGGGPPPQGPPAGQPPQQGGGNMPQPQGQFDLQTAAQAIARANPGIRPEVLVHALNKAMPYLNAQAQDSVRKATIELREQNLYIRERIADMQEGGRNYRQGVAEGGKDARADQADETKRRGQDMSFAAQRERTAASIKNAETRAQSGQNIQDEAKVIVDGIEKGITPPSLVGLYRARPAVEAEASRRGINLTQAQLEFKRAEKQVSTLNGPQMTRFSGLATSVVNTIDEVRDLSKQMQLSGIPLLNKAELAAYIQTQGNTPSGQLATRYVTAINTLKEEFANLAQGGYAPTESVWKLANKQINENYGVKQLGASLDEIQRLINYRVQAVPGMKQLGPGAPNRYTDPQGGQRQTQLKPFDDAQKLRVQGAKKNGWTMEQIKQQLDQEGIDTSKLPAN